MSTIRDKKVTFDVVILATYCKGCRLCVEVCPEGTIAVDPVPNERGILPAYVVPDKPCRGCLRCAAVCPDAAIEISSARAAPE